MRTDNKNMMHNFPFFSKIKKNLLFCTIYDNLSFGDGDMVVPYEITKYMKDATSVFNPFRILNVTIFFM